MKIACLQEHLKKGLATVGRVVSTRSPLPVLANILLSADQGRLKLAATDLEIGVTCWIDATIEEEGAITLPARLLTDIVGTLPNEMVSMTLDARTQMITLTCGRFTTNVKGIEADEFPPVPTAESGDALLRVPAPNLRRCIDQVAFAASNDESRPVLTGVLLRIGTDDSSTNTMLRLAAADGYRLATLTVALPTPPAAAPQDVIVPSRALSELARIIGTSDEEVALIITPNGSQVIFHTTAVDLVSRLIDGKFPDYERIIPATHTTRTVVDTQELAKAIKLASLFASANQNFVKLTIEPGSEGDDVPGRLIVTANASEIGDNTGELDGIVQGDAGKIAMNVKYLNEALGAIQTPQVALETQSPQSPGVLKPVGSDDYIHIIMPMTMR